MEITQGLAGAARLPSYVRLGNGWSIYRAEWLRKLRAIVEIYLARLIGMPVVRWGLGLHQPPHRDRLVLEGRTALAPNVKADSVHAETARSRLFLQESSSRIETIDSPTA